MKQKTPDMINEYNRLFGESKRNLLKEDTKRVATRALIYEGRLQDLFRRIMHGSSFTVVGSDDDSFDIVSKFAKSKGKVVGSIGQDRRYIYFTLNSGFKTGDVPWEYDKRSKEFTEFEFKYDFE